jgi:TRAP-type C4-dicarboxylate transport system permease small subunit
MRTFVRIVEWLSRICGIVAAIMLIVAVAVVCHMVFVRYGLKESSYWQTEFVTYILIASTFVGSPYVLMTRGHVFVELLPMSVGERPRFYLALLAYSIALAFCLLIAWLGWHLFLESWDNNWLSETIWEVRLWIPYLAMPVGFGILSLQYVVDIVNLLLGRDVPFGMDETQYE